METCRIILYNCTKKLGRKEERRKPQEINSILERNIY